MKCKVCNKSHDGKGEYCSRKCYLKLYFTATPERKRLHVQRVRKSRIRSYFNLTLEEHNNLTKKCYFCDWIHCINLHHIDHNKYNNSKNNFIALCPNHHMLIHFKKYRLIATEQWDGSMKYILFNPEMDKFKRELLEEIKI